MREIHFYRKCIVFALLSSVCAKRTHVWNTIKETKNPVCQTSDCQQLSQSVMEGINKNVDPCDNFYNYVCGRWAEHNPMPPNTGEWSVKDIMRAKMIHNLRSLLEEKEKRYDATDVVQAKKLYKACLKIPFLKRGNADFIKSFLKGIGNWIVHLSSTTPKVHEGMIWMLDNYYLKSTGESAFFGVGMMSNYHRKNNPLVLIQPPKSAYGSIIRSVEWTDIEKTAYLKFLREIAGVIVMEKKPLMSLLTIRKDVDDVLKFRRKLDKLLLLHNQNYVCKFTTLNGVQFTYDSNAKKASAKINWVEHGRVLFANMISKNFDGTMAVGLCQEDYFKGLGKLLSETDESTIANHVHIYFVERHLNFNPREKSLLSLAISSNSQVFTPHGRIRYDIERWESCIKHHNMRNTLAKMYANTHLGKEVKSSVEKMAEKIKEVMRMQVYESSWLGDITIERMTERLKGTGITYGYSEYTLDPILTISPKNSPSDPLQVNAAFMSDKNEMVLNVPALQFPVHSLSLPYIANYARLGFVIGHEMHYSLKKQEKITQGSPMRVWLSKNLRFLYDKKSECFSDQYKKYLRQQTQQYSVLNYLRDNDIITEEIAADTMGLKAAYEAYRKKLWKMKGECSVLTQFEKIGCEKLFFILYATQFCATISPNMAQKYWHKDSHCLPDFRVNGPLSNMMEFSTAFGCKPNTRMNTTIKCDMWD